MARTKHQTRLGHAEANGPGSLQHRRTGRQRTDHVYTAGYLEPDEAEALRRDGVVGDIATVFFRSDGSYRGIELNERASGPRLDLFEKVARRVCIVAGTAKLPALEGALRGG